MVLQVSMDRKTTTENRSIESITKKIATLLNGSVEPKKLNSPNFKCTIHFHPFRHCGAMVDSVAISDSRSRAGYSAGRYVGSFVAVRGPFGSEIATFAAQLYEAGVP